jgi:hypothetical protein
MKIVLVMLFCSLNIYSLNVFAKNKKTRDVQEVNFSEMSLKGTIRNPDGAYLVQKKGIKFAPLHDVQKDVDQKIRETALYID